MENNNKEPQSVPSKSNKNIIIIVVVVVVLILVGNMVRGYFSRKMSESITEKIIEKGTGGKVDIDNSTVKFSDKEGTFEVGTAKWPSDLSSEVPKFSAGELVAAARINNGSVNGWSIMIKNVEEDSVTGYTKQLEGAGWKTTSQVNFAAAIYQYEKGNLKLNLAYDPSSKGVNIMIEVVK